MIIFHINLIDRYFNKIEKIIWWKEYDLHNFNDQKLKFVCLKKFFSNAAKMFYKGLIGDYNSVVFLEFIH